MEKKEEVALFGEEIACRFLKKEGYRIIEKNYRTKFGEIDIIAQDNKTICFVEVKTRIDTKVSPKESVDIKKQERISKSALDYLKKNNLIKKRARFDVVSIEIRGDKVQNIELIKDAFYLNPKFFY